MHLKDEYYKPRDLSEDDELEAILDAILKQKAMALDTGFVADLVKYLYRFHTPEQKLVATDVFALDILRGRDHGLNTYVEYLSRCTKQQINDWSDLSSIIHDEVIHCSFFLGYSHFLAFNCNSFLQ